ncbi:hypothetical protein BaRGS_00019344, partial [Batillaria attramentaria]
MSADIRNLVKQFSSSYEADPKFGCTFNNPALQFDTCTQNLIVCSDFSFFATQASSIQETCGNFSEYVTCAQTRLSDCSAEVRAFADEYVVNATLLYNGNTYYCDERKLYDIDAAEIKFASCLETMGVGFSSSASRGDFCNAFQTAVTCVEDAKAIASPRQRAEFELFFADTSAPATVSPYFCNADNPCLEEFRFCNTSVVPNSLIPG